MGGLARRLAGFSGAVLRSLILARRRRLCWKIRQLEHALQLSADRVQFLEEQLETYRDTVQAFGLHNRAIGAEAVAYTETIKQPGGAV